MPYRLIDGTAIATSWSRFASPLHATTIDLQVDGVRIKPFAVYTGSNPDGSEGEFTCDNWATGGLDALGVTGYTANLVDGNWGAAVPRTPCLLDARLYCVEQLGGTK
jgi:hypothetical protein